MRVLRMMVPATLALVMLAMAAAPITAQDDASEESALIDALDGLEKMYSRVFMVDFSAAMEQELEPSWFALFTGVMQFESDEAAATALDTVAGMGLVSQTVAQDPEVEVESVTLDLESEYVASRVSTVDEGGTETIVQVTMQDGPRLYMIYGITSDEDPAPVVEMVATSMLEADVSDDPESFSEDGTSTGGLWTKFPTPADITAEVEALTEVEDEITFPAAGATPAA